MDQQEFISIIKDVLASPAGTGFILALVAKLSAAALNHIRKPEPGTQNDSYLHAAYLLLTCMSYGVNVILSGNHFDVNQIQQALSTFTAMIATHFIHKSIKESKKS